MQFPKMLTFFMLSTVLALAQPAWTRQRNVAPTLRSAPTGHVPGTRSVAARLPRHGRIKPPLRHADPKVGGTVAAVSDRRSVVGTPPLQKADLKVSATTPGGTSPGVAPSPATPLSHDQVVSMVRDGLGDESGAKLIEQRGIDFAPSEDFIQTLKAAGASEAFLNALSAAKPPEPASARKPLNQVQVFALLAAGAQSYRVTLLVQERGIDFDPTNDYLQEAGGWRRHYL